MLLITWVTTSSDDTFGADVSSARASVAKRRMRQVERLDQVGQEPARVVVAFVEREPGQGNVVPRTGVMPAR